MLLEGVFQLVIINLKIYYIKIKGYRIIPFYFDIIYSVFYFLFPFISIKNVVAFLLVINSSVSLYLSINSLAIPTKSMSPFSYCFVTKLSFCWRILETT
jgi:hypothetical protein